MYLKSKKAVFAFKLAWEVRWDCGNPHEGVTWKSFLRGRAGAAKAGKKIGANTRPLGGNALRS
ncbi:hypothetical protein MASR2M44_25520 [Bacteroidota bacterium]